MYHISGSVDNRHMSADSNFVYDSEGNLIEDRSKSLKISYDWRGMPVEFRMESKSGNVLENTRSADWERELVTHYTGIGTEVRESFHNGTPSETKVVVNMPQGLGRYGVEDAANSDIGFGAGYIPSTKYEWYLKNLLGSTMLVYGTQGSSNADVADLGEVKKAYDYRSFGEQIDLIADAGDKVTENFTGKEKDDETELNYFGARYLDPMLGLWISVDPKRQFASPYLYAGNGVNPIGAVDPDGNAAIIEKKGNNVKATIPVVFSGDAATADNKAKVKALAEYRFNGSFGKYNVQTSVVEYNPKIHGNTWNNINLLNEGSPKCGSSGSCVETRALPGQAYINVNNVHSIIHEFGHLLGLDDKYDSQYMGSGATYEGYNLNLMGDYEGFLLKENQIEEMWGPGEIRPSENYKVNDIRISE